MRNQRALFFLASVALCAWPLQTIAQDDSGFLLEEAPEKEPIVITTKSIEFGVGWLSTDSFKFGEYSGLTDEGPFGIANFDILSRSPYDGRRTEYWKFYGSNLALDSRSVHLEYGHQGQFKTFLDFSQIPHFATDDARTPYLGAGSSNLTLPPACTGGGGTAPGPGQTTCWDPSQNTPAASTAVPNPNMTQLDADLNDVKFKTQRTRYGGGFSVDLSEEWSFGGSFSREEKDGKETIAGIFASSGGTPRAAILPKPIDYATQDADAYVAYHGESLQAQLSYHLSVFDDQNSSLTWQNAYDAVAGWDADQNFANGGFGRLALEPDNSAHTVTLSAGYTLDPTTRLAGSLSYSRMLQDEAFLPYSTGAPGEFTAGGIAFGALPRDSLEGDVTKLHGAVSLAKQITPDLDLNAQYTFDDRQNDTPRDIFCVVHSDSLNQDANCNDPGDTFNTANARINRPYSRQQQDFEVDATYQLLPDTKVTLGYAFETINRDLTEVENTYEHTGSIKLASSPFSFASGWLKYAYSDRSGSDYISNEPVLASHTLAYITAQGGPDELFEQNPYLRKFYIANRARHGVSGALTLIPSDDISIGLLGSVDRSDFYDTLIGLTERDYASATLDVTYTPTEDVTLSGFFTYDRMTNDQTGYERGGAEIQPGDPLNPALFWTVNTLDQGFTAGFETEWTVIEDTLDLTFDYVFSYTVTEYGFQGAPALGAEPVPDVVSTWHSFGVRADYTFVPGWTTSLGYRFEMFDNDDFALDTGSSIPAVITLGSQSLDYTAHLVGVSMSYAF